MTSKSKVLAIGTTNSKTTDQVTVSKNRKDFFESDFEKHMQKILLNGEKPLTKEPNDALMQRFSANDLKQKDGKHYYDFGEYDKKGWFIDITTFEPKGILRRVHNKISKKHWVADNVARFDKNSTDFVMRTVSDASEEEKNEIYQYLCYLNSTTK